MSDNKGFTLIEMMITVAIAAILLTVAVPSFNNFINSNRLATEANSLIGAIQFAKSEAIKRNGFASICGDSSGVCGANWNNGYRVFIDNNNDCVLDNGETVVRIISAPTSNNITAVGCVTFSAMGAKSGGSNNANNPDFVICNTNLASNNGRQIFIAPSGSPRVATVTQNNCP